MSAIDLDFFSTLGDLFTQEKYDQIAKRYAYPNAAYFKNEMLIFKSAGNFVSAMAGLHQPLLTQGLDRMAPRIVAQSLPRGKYQTVWLSWSLFSKNEKLCDDILARYFCRTSPIGTPVVELTEFQAYFPKHLSGEPSVVDLAI